MFAPLFDTLGTAIFGDPRDDLRKAGRAYNTEYAGLLDALQQQAYGRESISREMLRQGLMRNVAAQNSLAAGARPGQQGVARRQAAQNAASLGAGFSGQQALASIAEKRQAMAQLQDAIIRKREQDIGLAGSIASMPTPGEKFLGAAVGAGKMFGVLPGGPGAAAAGAAAPAAAPAPAPGGLGQMAQGLGAAPGSFSQPQLQQQIAPQPATLSSQEQLWNLLYGGLRSQGVRF